MTVEEVIALACALRPNELGEDTLTALLEDLECHLSVEIRGEPPCCRAVKPKQLSVPAPYDKVYWTYLVSMIDLATGNTALYPLSAALYKEALDTYARWHQRTVGQGGKGV